MVILFTGILFLAIFIAGCTQSAGTVPVTPVVAAAGEPSGGSQHSVVTTGEPVIPQPEATGIPEPVVTMVRYISQVRDVKDSRLLFSLQVPVEWSLSTYRIENPENYEGYMYQTDVIGNNTFYIHTFIDYRSREQNYRDDCRRWVPAPAESVVVINDITFDRFESTSDGRTNVMYVARKTGVNDFGYLSVLSFSADAGNPFGKEDYEKVIASFRYHGRESVSTMPGEEIPRIEPVAGEGGSVKSATRSGSSAPASSSSGCSSCRG